MSTYIGMLGRLIQLRRVRTQDVEYWDGRTFQRTLEGRMRVQAKGTRNRAWSLSMELATPADLANVQALLEGEFGRGPFVFVPPAAPTTNMLMPDVSTCGPSSIIGSNVTAAGPLQLPDGSWVGRSLSNLTPSQTLRFGPDTTPVIPGITVTGSAYVVGAAAKVGVQFFNAAGAVVSQAVSAQSGIAGVATRLAVTLIVPALAVACTVYATATAQAARPALTWTDEVYAWGIGAGCSKVIPHGFSSGLSKVMGKPQAATLSSLGFTVQEVG